MVTDFGIFYRAMGNKELFGLIAAVAACVAGDALGAEVVRSATAVTPGAEWAKGKPEDHGFDPAVLAKVPDYIRAKNLGTTGLMVVSGGQVIFSYGDVAEVSYIASCRKSVLSMMYGKYVRNGTIILELTRIASLDRSAVEVITKMLKITDHLGTVVVDVPPNEQGTRFLFMVKDIWE